MRGKILIKKLGGEEEKIKIRYLVAAVLLASLMFLPQPRVNASSCPDIRIVFARGSGSERWTDQNYLQFKSTIESKISSTALNYEFIDLDYPAIGVGVDNLDVTLGAFFGSGDAYEFGESIKTGVNRLQKLVNSPTCQNTKYVIGGYSQGAMVVSRALGSLSADRIVYAATFGDPKLYLPEGEGLMPAACRGENLSDYRMYVPDCQAYKGMLGAYIPYEPDAYYGKVGTWCNKRDIFCSSHLNVSDHLAYVSENLYEDASRVIFDKICKQFGVKNTISSPHDTAILIDSSGSMENLIANYKAEALRLATETLNSGGRVALYDYRDLDDPYQPLKHCDFESCTLERFTTELENIVPDGGGDAPESLLSASFHVMKDLKWKYGATKSLVVLTDADFLSPDRDGMTFDEVVAVSKKIDPVNFYIVTNPDYGDTYQELAAATDGKVVTNFDELSLLTKYIMERYDALPRVEEELTTRILPELKVESINNGGNSAVVKISTTGNRTLVALNDAVLGITNETEFTIDGLMSSTNNTLTLVPLGDDVRGEAVEVSLDAGTRDESTEKVSLDGNARDENSLETSSDNSQNVKIIVPKVPNTGRR